MLNSPAWPATPPMRRAVGSWTTPRSITWSGPAQGQPYGVHISVGAMRGLSDSGGLNIVSRMPSGPASRSCTKRSNGIPATRETMSARRKKLMSL